MLYWEQLHLQTAFFLSKVADVHIQYNVEEGEVWKLLYTVDMWPDGKIFGL